MSLSIGISVPFQDLESSVIHSFRTFRNVSHFDLWTLNVVSIASWFAFVGDPITWDILRLNQVKSLSSQYMHQIKYFHESTQSEASVFQDCWSRTHWGATSRTLVSGDLGRSYAKRIAPKKWNETDGTWRSDIGHVGGNVANLSTYIYK